MFQTTIHISIYVIIHCLCPKGKVGRSGRTSWPGTGPRARVLKQRHLRSSKAPRSGLVGKVFCSCSIETTKKTWCSRCFLLMFVDVCRCFLVLVESCWCLFLTLLIGTNPGRATLSSRDTSFSVTRGFGHENCVRVTGGCLIGKKDCRVNPMGSHSHFQTLQ